MKKSKERSYLNIGTIVLLMIVVYIAIHVIMNLNKTTLTVFEVTESKINQTIEKNALAIRDEQVVKAEEDGYCNYYVKNATLIKNNSMVYTMDSTGKVATYIANLASRDKTTQQSSLDAMVDTVETFHENYTDVDFHEIYSLKYNLNTLALSYGNDILTQYKDEIDKELGEDCFRKYFSDHSGVVTYFTDGYENKKASAINASDFDLSKYNKKELRSNDKIKKGDAVYRLTKGQDWTLVCELNKEEYELLKQKERVTITIKKDLQKLSVPIKIKKKDGSYFAYFSLDSYMVKYVDERFLDIQIDVKVKDGLKIPNSSIVNKYYYKIPDRFLQEGGKKTKYQIVSRYEKEGETVFSKKDINVAKIEGGYCYIEKKYLQKGTILCVPDSKEIYFVDQSMKMDGVYCINRGFAEYKFIQIAMQNEDYAVVETETKQGIAQFDRIALNGNSISDNQVIY